MDIVADRIADILTFLCRGRLDGFGAGILEEKIRESLQDDDRSIVVDMGEVDYLSSAGIRVLLVFSKMLKQRKGILALARVRKYPAQVLDMAGFFSVFSQYSSIEEAVNACQRSAERDDLLIDVTSIMKVRNGMKFSIEPGSSAPASLELVGDLEDVLHARITRQHITARSFSETRYALGLGAMGGSVDDALLRLGEMVILHGSMVWLPTDGHNTPDFFTPLKDSGDVKIYTGYAITLNGNFHEFLTIEAESFNGMTVDQIYHLIFTLAKEKGKGRGVIAVAMWGICAGLESSGIQKSPIAAHAPPDGKSILDPQYFEEWMSHDTVPKYRGDTMVSFGIGVDISADLSGFDENALNSLYYVHPSNRTSGDMFLHNHGVIFRNVPYDPSSSLDPEIQKIVTTGEFVDMRHLMDSTRLKKAVVGVAYISEIRKDSAP
ncbi:MAG TPA: STAS domain-containing protein [Methanoregulaceae archaeon]|nr:STAS domain-containing protein [Methanoregulaceae archaeon]